MGLVYLFRGDLHSRRWTEPLDNVKGVNDNTATLAILALARNYDRELDAVV